jgi:hypothetical protein
MNLLSLNLLRARPSLRSIFLALTLGAAPTFAADISDDFTAGLDPLWFVYNPFAPFGVKGSVTAQDGVVTISHPPSPAPQIAPALISIERNDVYWSDFELSVEFSGWPVGTKINPTLALGGRNNPAPDGTPTGYALSVIPNSSPEIGALNGVASASIGLETVVGGRILSPSLAWSTIPDLDPTKWYRAVFSITTRASGGATARGKIYEVGNDTPIQSCGWYLPKPAYYAGGVALGALDRAGLFQIANNGVSFKLDNFKASGTPVTPVSDPAINIQPAVVLDWPAATVGWILESSAAANGPWTKSTQALGVVADQNQVVVDGAASHQFFRLRKP